MCVRVEGVARLWCSPFALSVRGKTNCATLRVGSCVQDSLKNVPRQQVFFVFFFFFFVFACVKTIQRLLHLGQTTFCEFIGLWNGFVQ